MDQGKVDSQSKADRDRKVSRAAEDKAETGPVKSSEISGSGKARQSGASVSGQKLGGSMSSENSAPSASSSTFDDEALLSRFDTTASESSNYKEENGEGKKRDFPSRDSKESDIISTNDVPGQGSPGRSETLLLVIAHNKCFSMAAAP